MLLGAITTQSALCTGSALHTPSVLWSKVPRVLDPAKVSFGDSVHAERSLYRAPWVLTGPSAHCSIGTIASWNMKGAHRVLGAHQALCAPNARSTVTTESTVARGTCSPWRDVGCGALTVLMYLEYWNRQLISTEPSVPQTERSPNALCSKEG